MEDRITLDELPLGKDGIIDSVECEDVALRYHILDMGLVPNVEVTLIKMAPMGDPIEIMVRGYNLTLRKADAKKIFLKNIHNANACKKKNRPKKQLEHSFKGEVKPKTFKKSNLPPKTKLKFALAGNQNSGKTTLFNALTGSNQHVGNFPGVTVDKKDGTIKGYKNSTITDLPGIYSLSPYSSEEIISRNFILEEKPDCIINIVDATNIERNLLLTLQLIELNVPMVIALNMMDEITQNGGTIDINGLENALGVPVVPISAAKGEGVGELAEHAINVAKYSQFPNKLDFCPSVEGARGAVHRCIHSVIHIIDDHAKVINMPVRFAAVKLIEGDFQVLEALNLQEKDALAIKEIVSQMEAEVGLEAYMALVDMRFNFIEKLCDEFVSKPQESKEYKFSQKIDKVLTGKYTALLAFLVIMGLIFYFTFGPFGTFFQDKMEVLIENITNIVDSGLSAWGLNKVVHSLIIDGVFTGVGSVLSFLPVIVILFFFLSIMEDTGYMARVAFVMDKALRKIGLSGRSFVPMLIGFGCSVPAIMATRTLPSARDRKMTILLTPFMSCSAKLPIYALFTAAFFKENQVLVIVSLYLIGIIVGIITAFIMKIFVFKGETVPFVMELPNYRMPSVRNVLQLIYTKAKGFITKAFSIIFYATIIIWFLQTFDIRLNVVADAKDSILNALGTLIVPIFRPLGIDDWRISTAFITGFMAKESVVSTLSVLLGDVSNLPLAFSKLGAFVFLVFSLLYTPCVAAIATVRRELGALWALGVVIFQCSIAWFVAFLVYHIGLLI